MQLGQRSSFIIDLINKEDTTWRKNEETEETTKSTDGDCDSDNHNSLREKQPILLIVRTITILQSEWEHLLAKEGRYFICYR